MNRRKRPSSAMSYEVRAPGQAARDDLADRGRSSLITSDQQGPGREGPRRRDGRALFLAIAYFLLSGIVSLTIGAAVSLTTSGTGRLALWLAVTGVSAVVAGIAYESRLMREWFPAFRIRRDQFGRS